MPAYIHTIHTCLPGYSYDQLKIRDLLKELLGEEEKLKSLIHLIYSRSGIQKRHSVLPEIDLVFSNGEPAGTGDRNKLYRKEAGKLFIEAAKGVINSGAIESAGSITHLVTISCTGFYAPGQDFDLIRNFQLSPDVERYHLGFMGCYAAISGLRLAARICESDPEACVLVISGELCTLHFQGGTSIDELISGSVFADGAAAAIVSGSAPRQGPALRLDGFTTFLANEGDKDMDWTIGDTGFDMVLSSRIPDLISDNLQDLFKLLQKRLGVDQNRVDKWAVHPGGRAILDKLQKELNLDKSRLEVSRSVLAEYGNMSSATILFVLKRIMEQSASGQQAEQVLSMAFGPGLTVETALMSLIESN